MNTSEDINIVYFLLLRFLVRKYVLSEKIKFFDVYNIFLIN